MPVIRTVAIEESNTRVWTGGKEEVVECMYVIEQGCRFGGNSFDEYFFVLRLTDGDGPYSGFFPLTQHTTVKSAYKHFRKMVRMDNNDAS